MPFVTKRELAKADLIEHYVYLAENASIDVADRFLDSADASFTALARQPTMGAPLRLKRPELANIRKWRVKDFDNHLIFYEPRPDGASIVRVLHSASDWWQLLGFEN